MGLAAAGEPARARALLDEIGTTPLAEPATMRVWIAAARALASVRSGRADEALSTLRPLARFERGLAFGLAPIYVRALAEHAAGRTADAAATFASLTSLRMVNPAGPFARVADLARARALRDAGDTAGARAAYDAFLASWAGADPDAPLLAAATRERAALPR